MTHEVPVSLPRRAKWQLTIPEDKEAVKAAMPDGCPACQQSVVTPEGLKVWCHQYTGYYWCPLCDYEWECSWNRQMIDDRVAAA
jgi:hypothetical protein